jgi:hypothetical protein
MNLVGAALRRMLRNCTGGQEQRVSSPLMGEELGWGWATWSAESPPTSILPHDGGRRETFTAAPPKRACGCEVPAQRAPWDGCVHGPPEMVG